MRVYQLPHIQIAVGIGFEPMGRYRPTVFKTAALDHSANLPYLLRLYQYVKEPTFEFCEPREGWTLDPGIKSAVLYQLSYGFKKTEH